ncbi:MAG: YebC/PmpR family DNA-binding transcriptional regulator [Candidatus Omnitrophica bacterium]|nr:YebC/PmpR family DNA-binding transcriptional regulator [Candidatus Omnitrophota bacterium]
MAGHSKWKGIKHKKAIVDAQRSKAFTKVVREITVAAKLGGGSPDGNARLRMAISKAREVNLPKDKIEQAIKKGTGELPGVVYEETGLEGYGPGGVAVLVQALTDNKNRTAAELRSIFTKHGGNVAGAGSVSWLFEKKGSISVAANAAEEDRLMTIALDAGAEDFSRDGESYTILTDPQHLEPVKRALTAQRIAWESADLTLVASSSVRVDQPAQANSLLNLLDALEDHEDVQHVYANFDIPDNLLAMHAASAA